MMSDEDKETLNLRYQLLQSMLGKIRKSSSTKETLSVGASEACKCGTDPVVLRGAGSGFAKNPSISTADQKAALAKSDESGTLLSISKPPSKARLSSPVEEHTFLRQTSLNVVPKVLLAHTKVFDNAATKNHVIPGLNHRPRQLSRETAERVNIYQMNGIAEASKFSGKRLLNRYQFIRPNLSWSRDDVAKKDLPEQSGSSGVTKFANSSCRSASSSSSSTSITGAGSPSTARLSYSSGSKGSTCFALQSTVSRYKYIKKRPLHAPAHPRDPSLSVKPGLNAALRGRHDVGLTRRFSAQRSSKQSALNSRFKMVRSNDAPGSAHVFNAALIAKNAANSSASLHSESSKSLLRRGGSRKLPTKLIRSAHGIAHVTPNLSGTWLRRDTLRRGAMSLKRHGCEFRLSANLRSLRRVRSKENKGLEATRPARAEQQSKYRFVKEAQSARKFKYTSRVVTAKRITASQALKRSVWVAKWKLTTKNRYCMFFNKFGKCKKGKTCKYIHDPDKVAVCTRFLRGTCNNAKCAFSHKIDKNKMPVCMFFLRGLCNHDDCPYAHVNVGKSAQVCDEFLKGYCPRGSKCEKKHVMQCEEFSLTGSCAKGESCKLPHRALVRRKRRRYSSLSTSRPPKLFRSKVKSGGSIGDGNSMPHDASKSLRILPRFVSDNMAQKTVQGYSPVSSPIKTDDEGASKAIRPLLPVVRSLVSFPIPVDCPAPGSLQESGGIVGAGVLQEEFIPLGVPCFDGDGNSFEDETSTVQSSSIGLRFDQQDFISLT